MTRRTSRLRWLFLGYGAVACSSAEALVEYPPVQAPAPTDPADAGNDPPEASAPEAAAPPKPTGEKVLDGATHVEGVTSDGHVVLSREEGIMVLPAGTKAPVLLAKDFDFGAESFAVRGAFVALWRGEDVRAMTLSVWSATGGLATVGPKSLQGSLLVGPSNVFGHMAFGPSVLRYDVFASGPGKGAGTKVALDVDTGVIDANCRPSTAFVGTDLVIGGCVGAKTTRSVAVYKGDGSGLARTLVESALPGQWINHAGSAVLVNVAGGASLFPVSGAAALPIEGPMRQASFSATDERVVYRLADGTVRRAKTTAPIGATTIGSQALVVLGASPDMRHVAIATTGSPNDRNTDLVVLRASAADKRVIAAKKAAYLGFSKDGSSVVYLTERHDTLFEGALEVANVDADAPPVRLSEQADRITVTADAVYWFETPEGEKKSRLLGARFATPKVVVTLATGLDPLIARAAATADGVYVGDRAGLFHYPAL